MPADVVAGHAALFHPAGAARTLTFVHLQGLRPAGTISRFREGSLAQHFDPRSAPFDRLTAGELDIVRDSLDIAYYRPNETIIAADSAPESLYIVIKGAVEER